LQLRYRDVLFQEVAPVEIDARVDEDRALRQIGDQVASEGILVQQIPARMRPQVVERRDRVAISVRGAP